MQITHYGNTENSSCFHLESLVDHWLWAGDDLTAKVVEASVNVT